MNVFDLTNASIDAFSELFSSALQSSGIDKQTALKARLTAEDILLKYRQKLGADSVVSFHTEKRMSREYFVLNVDGAAVDPFDDLTEEDLLLHNVLESIGCVPTWTYKNGKNGITFSFKKKERLPAWASILLVAILGIVLGLAAHLLPDTPRTVLTDTVMSPLSTAIMGFLGTVSILMFFLSIISGICEMGDVATFNRIGKRMIGRFALWLLILTGIIFGITLLRFPVGEGDAGGFDFAALWKMLLNIIPTNILDAFYTGNTLQVIFLATCIGVVALTIIHKTQMLHEWTRQLNSLVQTLIELIIKLLPVVVFVSIFSLFASGELRALAEFYTYPLYHLLICFGWSVLMLLCTAIKQKVNVVALLKKLLPTYLIALSTASSSAAFHENMETCEKRLGIDKQIVNVGVPLAQSLLKPSFVIEGAIGTLCMAQLYHVEITWSMVATLLIMVFVLSVATPPMPGAAISSFTLVFAQCGVPAGAISLIIALVVITDRISTPTNVLTQQLSLVQLSGSLHKLDHSVLRDKTK